MLADDEHGGLHRALRRRLIKMQWAEPVDLRGKTVLVTGATQGSLGHETAVTLARWGADVCVTTRTQVERAVDAVRARVEGGSVAGHSLNLADRQSVDAFVRWFDSSRGDALDVLVNNAGVHLDLLSQWKEPRRSADGFEIQWRINYLGTAHLTHRLLPALIRAGRDTGDARIVNVVSKLYSRGANQDLFERTRRYNSWDAYGNSKLALVHMTLALDERHAEKDGVRAYCLHPGSVFTHVAARGLENTGFVERVRNALSPIEAFFLKSPEEGAQTQIHCATAPRLDGGLYYEDCQPRPSSHEAADVSIRKRLFDTTLDWVLAS
ncbi:MAG: SDR family NAD(P)-dependent oxidoreductase [Myxococcota bacterium]